MVPGSPTTRDGTRSLSFDGIADRSAMWPQEGFRH